MAELTKLGRYQLKGVLGRGAMGVVYEGLDPSLNRRVAVKTILKNAAIDAETAQMYSAQFAREAQAAGRLNHPNIVGVHDFAEEGDVAYLVMEYIQGRELRSFFEAKEKFEITEVVRIMGELLDALGFAHDAGVIHRDIKPANVMLDANRRVKLADFGVARIQDSERSAAGTMVGTPAFMSPEQISGGKIDKRTDLFSAGTILYQLLTGDQPFTGAGAWTVAKKIMQDDPPRPSSVVKSVSPAFDVVVNKALAKKSADRYASAKEFADALRGALGPAQPSATATTPPVPAPRPAQGAQAASPATEAEVEFWKAIQNSTDAAEFEFYLEQFPEGTYAGLARHKIARLTQAPVPAGESTVRLQAEAAAKQREAEEKARLEAEAQAKRQAEREAELQAAAKARRDAAEKARQEAEAAEAKEKARREAAEKATQEAEAKARREAETRARVEAELKAKREADEKAKQERARQAAALAKLREQEAARASEDPEATVAIARPSRPAPAPAAASAPPSAVESPKKSFVVPAIIGAVVVIGGAVAFFAMNRAPAPVPVAEVPASAPVAPPAPAAPVVDEAKIRREVEERIRREYADKSAAEQAAAAKAATEKAVAEKQLAAKSALTDKAAAEKAVAEKAAAEKVLAEKLAAAKSAGEKAALEKAAAEKAAAEQAAAEKAAAEKVAAEKAAAEKHAAEKAAAAKAAAARKPGWPAVGDKWTYEAKDSQNPAQRGSFTVEVKAVGPGAITETIVRGNGSQSEITHGPGIKLVSVQPGIVAVNPYLRSFQDLSPGQSWRSVDYGSLFRCNSGFDCSVSGKVVGREKVSVKAGTFDAVKVVFEVFTTNTGGGRAVIEVRYWYAEAVNRFVKYELRTVASNFSQPLMDQELVSYTPGGGERAAAPAVAPASAETSAVEKPAAGATSVQLERFIQRKGAGRVLQREPAVTWAGSGGMPSEVFYINDGTCAQGQIKELTTASPTRNVQRGTRCIPLD